MRLSVVQMNPGADKHANIDQARTLIGEAVDADRADIVSLPEMWSCLGGDRDAKWQASEILPPPASNQPGGDAYEFLRSTARDRRIVVHGGSIAERDGERLFNTTLIFGPDGAELARYRKIHLFDIVTPGGVGYRESASYGGGSEVVTCAIGDTTVGCAICYDLRFAELFVALRRAGADIIFLPAAFTVETGRDHWEPLIRARAIETQCWIAASATWGQHLDGTGAPRATYGHSLICDPWGTIVARVSDGLGWTTAKIDPALTARVRRNMPVMEHRRLV